MARLDQRRDDRPVVVEPEVNYYELADALLHAAQKAKNAQMRESEGP